MNSWYFAPALKHYCIIKAVTETRDVRLSDTFKLKNHVLQAPRVSPTEFIVKYTQALAQIIEGKNDASLDELATIANI